jgi:hypothetical protein
MDALMAVFWLLLLLAPPLLLLLALPLLLLTRLVHGCGYLLPAADY